jgi:hypothetical protein
MFGTQICCVAQVQLRHRVARTLPHQHLGMQASIVGLYSIIRAVMTCTSRFVVQVKVDI